MINTQRIMLITNNKGQGIVTISTNNPTLVVNTPSEQVSDLSHVSNDLKQGMIRNPRAFNKDGKKRNEADWRKEEKLPSVQPAKKHPFLERIESLEQEIATLKLEKLQNKPVK